MKKRSGESGNIFFTLFGAIALVGVVGVATSTLMRGPVGTVLTLNQRAKIESQLQIARKLAALDAATQTGDADSDGVIEPSPPDITTAGCGVALGLTGGGCLPTTVGAAKEDPWGTMVGYCGWDHGPDNSPGGATDGLISGSNIDYPNPDFWGEKVVIAVISAGPDRTFQTSCNAHNTYVSEAADSDDIIMAWTFEEASDGVGGGLWSLVSGDPNKITTDKNLEIASNSTFASGTTASFQGTADFGLGSVLDFSGGGLLDLPRNATCNSANDGMLQINTGGSNYALELCEDGTGWLAIGGGAVSAAGNEGEIQFNTGNVMNASPNLFWDNTNGRLGIGTSTVDDTLEVVGTADISSTLDVGGTLGVTGVTTLNNNLNVVGGATAVDFDGTLNVDGNTALGGTLGVVGAGDFDSTLNVDGNTTLGGTLGVVGAGDFDSTLNVDGNTDLRGTLNVEGAISDANSDVTIADGLNVSGGVILQSTLDAQGEISNSGGDVVINDSLNIKGDISNSDGFVTIADIFSIDSLGQTEGDTCASYAPGAITFDSAADQLLVCSSLASNTWVTVGTSGGGGGGGGGRWDSGDTFPDIKFDAGDVGIGLTDPQAPLHVAGNVLFSSGSTHVEGGDFYVTGTHTGTASVPESGAGARMFFDVESSAFRAGGIAINQWDDVNIGNYSTAFGYNNVASGKFSTALGQSTTASANSSLAMGFGTIASSPTSTAFGSQTTATNWYATAFGKEAVAGGRGSLAIGLLDASQATDPQVTGDRSFGIFMGAGNDSQSGVDITASDLLALLGGKMLIDPASPATQTNVSNTLALDVHGDLGAMQYCDEDGANCFTAADITGGATGIWEDVNNVIRPTSGMISYVSADFLFGSPSMNDDTNTDHDSRMFFDKSASAFRAGWVYDDKWDAANVGYGSVAIGSDVIASGSGSAVFGGGNTASGDYGFAAGTDVISTGYGAVALGYTTDALEDMSFAMGHSAVASGYISTAIGMLNVASGDGSMSFGQYVVSGDGTSGSGFGDHSVTFGLLSGSQATKPQVTGDRSFAIFMGDGADSQSAVDVTANDVMALLGGTMVIDPSQPATRTAPASAGDQDLEFNVVGDIGATNYCDVDGNNCFAASEVGTFTPPGLDGQILFNSGGTTVGADTNFVFTSAGALGIGTDTPRATLDIVATDAAILPVGLNTNRPGSPVAGMIRYNTDILGFEYWNGSQWNSLAACSGNCSGSAGNLGDGPSNTSPRRSGDAATGFYSAAANTVSVAAGGRQAMRWNTAASGVNFFDVTPAATGASPVFAAAGSDANIGLTFNPKGTGVVTIGGTAALTLPAGLDADRPTGVPGMIRYNSTSDVFEGYINGTGWDAFASASGGVSEINDLSDAFTDYATDQNFILGRSSATALTAGAQYNMFIGKGAGATSANSTSSTDSNTAVGYNALAALASGMGNTALGTYALRWNSSGDQNIGIGYNSLGGSTTGGSNVAIGYWAMYRNTTGANNVAIGNQALRYNDGKQGSTAVGHNAMFYADNTTTGSVTYNTAIGYRALYGSTTAANNTGTQNTALGSNTLYNNTSGGDNVAIGYQAGDLNTTGNLNILIGSGGVDAPTATTNYYLNIGNAIYGAMDNDAASAVGDGAASITIDGDLTVTGTCTGCGGVSFPLDVEGETTIMEIATGNVPVMISDYTNENLTFGHQSGQSLTPGVPAAYNGQDNTLVGQKAGWGLTEGYRNSFFGTSAGYQTTTGSHNVAIGDLALRNNTTGWANVAVGHQALNASVGKLYNVAVGYYAMRNADNAASGVAYNVALGYSALQGSGTAANNTGVKNTALGSRTLINNTSGGNNVAIGHEAGDLNTTGDLNILIGSGGVDAPTATTNYYLNIGNAIYGAMDNDATSAVGDGAASITIDGDLTVTGTCTGCGGAGSSLWEDVSGTGAGPIRPTSGTVNYASADFLFGSPQLADDGNAAHDARMFFDKSKGAFRAGEVPNAQWDDGNIGNRSIGLGYDVEASGWSSVALNESTTASGNSSLAAGWLSTASGTSALATGAQTVASGTSSTAIGKITSASGVGSFALGHQVIAGDGTGGSGAGDYSVAFGLLDSTQTTKPQITGDRSFAIFMGTGANSQSGVDVTASDVMALLGGKMVIDPNQPATQTTPRGVLDLGAATDALVLPMGADGDRPASPVAGMIRFSSTSTSFEGYDGSSWGSLASGGSVSLPIDVNGNETAVMTDNSGTEVVMRVDNEIFGLSNNIGWQYNDASNQGYNTVFGVDAGKNITTGHRNTFVGYYAGLDTTTGQTNTAMGVDALKANVTGSSNVAIGTGAGQRAVGASNNVFMGSGAGDFITDSNNTIIGADAAANAGSASSNVVIGRQAAATLAGGDKNILIGSLADVPTAEENDYLNIGNAIYGTMDTNGTSAVGDGEASITIDGDLTITGTCTGCGSLTFPIDIEGEDNVMEINSINWSMFKNILDDKSIAIGPRAGQALTNANNAEYNTLFGYDAGKAVSSGDNNTLLGASAGQALTTTSNNTFVGKLAGSLTTTGGHNALFGTQAGQYSALGDSNVLVGSMAGQYNSASNNTALGFEALRGSTTAANNTGIQNTALGAGSLYNSTSGGNNVAIGFQAGDLNTTGNLNILIGSGGVDAPTATTNYYLNIGNAIYGAMDNDATSAVGDGGASITIDGDLTITGTCTGCGGGGSISFPLDVDDATSPAGQVMSINAGVNNFLYYSSSLNNLALGNQAGDDLSTGNKNTMIGSLAGGNVADGTDNTLMGYKAGELIVAGVGNTLLGSSAGKGITSGADNTFVGMDAGLALSSGNDNTFIGVDAGTAVGTGTGNIMIGKNTGGNITSGNLNIIIGAEVGGPSGASSSYLNIGNALFGAMGDTTSTVDGGADITIDGDLTITGTCTGCGGAGSSLWTDNTTYISRAGIVAVTGTIGSGDTLPAGLTGAGTRAYFYPRKGAFRAGTAAGTLWDDASIGNNSAAFGSGTSATVANTMAWGDGADATGTESTAWGFRNVASGVGSTAWGSFTAASQTDATAFGGNTIASAHRSTASGLYTVASGTNSFAAGAFTLAQSFAEFSVGQYSLSGGTAGSWVSTDVLFEVGNGTSSGARNNAFTILKNGNTTIDGDLTITGTCTGCGGGGGGGAITDLSDAFTDYTTEHNFIAGRASAAALTAGAQYNTFIGEGAGATSANSTSTTDKNTALGHNALGSLTSSSQNTAIGADALANHTSGERNVAVGVNTLFANTTGIQNTAIGANAMYQNTVGSNNFAAGYNALFNNRKTSRNTAIGNSAMFYADSNTTGNGAGWNTAVGESALRGSTTPANNTGSYNVSIGPNTLLNNTSGSNNVVMGHQAGILNTTGNLNVLIGSEVDAPTATTNYYLNIGNAIYGAMDNDATSAVGDGGASITIDGNLTVTGTCTGCGGGGGALNDLSDAYTDYATDDNMIIGRASATALTSGAQYNLFIGEGAGATSANSTATTDDNTAVGYNSLSALTTGYKNTAVGNSALLSNASGTQNTAVGYWALRNNSSGWHNVAIGNSAFQTNVAKSGNTAVGVEAMRFADLTSSGSYTYNAALGYQALYGSTTPANNTGTKNTAVGAQTLYSNTSGYENTASGYRALYSNTSGVRNVASGYDALYSNIDGAVNIAIGWEAMKSSKALDYNTAIGTNAMRYANDTATRTTTYNVAVGTSALRGSITAANNTGLQNTALGSLTLLNNTSGSDNVAIGYLAGDLNTTGNLNILIGSGGVDAPTATTNYYLNIGNAIYGAMDNDATSAVGDGGASITIDGNLTVTGTCTGCGGGGSSLWTDNTTYISRAGIVAVTGTLGSGDTLPAGLTGAGTRAYFYPRKGAFRAGTAAGTLWDDASIGNNSAAFGSGTSATVANTMAWGDGADATGTESTAWGFRNVASGVGSTAWGSFTAASQTDATAFGGNTIASAHRSTASGLYTVASGTNSTAAGAFTLAQSFAEFSIGQYSLSGGTAGSWVLTDVLFEIGNGTSSGARNNAVTVLKNGNMGIGVAAPDVELDVSGDIEYTGTITDVSDMRLKTDITPLDTQSVFDRLSAVDTYSFRMKDDPKGRIELGVMAQEVEKVFPELVKTANDEMQTKSVNYVGFIAPLIEASNALKAENDALKAELEQVKAEQADRLAALETDIKGLKAHTGYGLSKAEIGLWMLLGMAGGGALIFFVTGGLRRRRA